MISGTAATTPRQRFVGGTALVTGATSGIGLATAALLISEGATVVLTGRRAAELRAACETLGERAIGVPADVTRLDDVERLFEVVADRVPALDVVVANAGAAAFARLGEYDDQVMDVQFGLNFKGIVRTVQGALPLMGAGGSIVLNSSIEGLRGSPGLGLYAAMKAAQRSLVRTWAVELGDRGIRVNAVSPGVVPTEAYEREGITLADLEPLLPRIASHRLGTVDEIAQVIAFLASDDSAYVNAANLVADGGNVEI